MTAQAAIPIYIDFPYTSVFEWNLNSLMRYNINQGGTWSSKTRACIQVMMMRAATDPGSSGTVVGQEYDHMDQGVVKDMYTVWGQSNFFKRKIKRYKKGKRILQFRNGSTIQFKRYRTAMGAQGPKRDYLYLVEANNLSYELYQKLEERTTKQIFFCYNPDAEFWVHRQVEPLPNAVRFISNCFDHNPFCPEHIKQNIFRKGATDENYLRVYGYGLTGKIQGLVFKNIKYTNRFPRYASKVGYGLDFGFANDQTALVKMGEYRGDLYGQQMIYELGFFNSDIAKRMDELGISRRHKIMADARYPKDIAELRKIYKYRVHASDARKNSIKYSIGFFLA